MNQQLFSTIQEKFDNYVSNFCLAEPHEQQNIDLKYKHSYKVCQNMSRIIEDILSPPESYIAQTIALLHDIGRFRQYKKYKTFADAKSEDHAQLGIKVIQDNNLLAGVKEDNKKLILQAIQYHNKAHLPTEESDRCLFYSRLIRDADKLDIWRVVINEYSSSSTNEAVALELSTKEEISAEVYHKIMQEEVVKYEELKTLNDFKLLQMGWVFEINFAKSFEIINEKEYIERLYATLPSTTRAEDIYTKINSYLQTQIK